MRKFYLSILNLFFKKKSNKTKHSFYWKVCKNRAKLLITFSINTITKNTTYLRRWMKNCSVWFPLQGTYLPEEVKMGLDFMRPLLKDRTIAIFKFLLQMICLRIIQSRKWFRFFQAIFHVFATEFLSSETMIV